MIKTLPSSFLGRNLNEGTQVSLLLVKIGRDSVYTNDFHAASKVKFLCDGRIYRNSGF